MGRNVFHEALQKKPLGEKILLWMICEECVYIRNYARCSDIMITSQILRLKSLQSILKHHGKIPGRDDTKKNLQSPKGILWPSSIWNMWSPRLLQQKKRAIFSQKYLILLSSVKSLVPGFYSTMLVSSPLSLLLAIFLFLISICRALYWTPFFSQLTSFSLMALKLDRQVKRERERQNIVSVLDSFQNFRFVFQSPIPYLHLDVNRHSKPHIA